MSPGQPDDALAHSANDIAQRVTLSPAARGLVRDGQTAAQLLEELLKKEDFTQAGLFLAHALPKREAVWWACQCARQAPAADGPPADAALRAAERWVSEPTDEHRRAAHAAAEAAGVGTPAGCAALAAFLSGGSLAPPGIAEVPPAEHLTAAAVAGAVTLAAVIQEPEKAPERYQKFFALGFDVANGKNRWREPQPG